MRQNNLYTCNITQYYLLFLKKGQTTAPCDGIRTTTLKKQQKRGL